MNKFLSMLSSRLVPARVAALAAVVLLAPAAANATPTSYVVTLEQQGNNVVATGSGAFDLTGLTRGCVSCGFTTFETINPSVAFINIGAALEDFDIYYGSITGPGAFGSGSSYEATSLASGSTILFDATGASVNDGVPTLAVPTGYVQGVSLANTTTWEGATFASLGVAPGTYVWKWGTGAAQRFTLDVEVPEPAAFGMFGVGVLLIGAFVGLRRRAK